MENTPYGSNKLLLQNSSIFKTSDQDMTIIIHRIIVKQ